MVQSIIRHAANLKNCVHKNFVWLFGMISVLYIVNVGSWNYASIFLGAALVVVFNMALSDMATHEISLNQLLGLLVFVMLYRLILEDSFFSIFIRFGLAGSFFWMQQLMMRRTVNQDDSDGENIAYIPYFAVALLFPVLIGVTEHFKESCYYFGVLSSIVAYFDQMFHVYFDSVIGIIPIIICLSVCVFELYRRRDTELEVTMGTGDVLFLSVMFIMLPPTYFFITYMFSLILMLLGAALVQKGENV